MKNIPKLRFKGFDEEWGSVRFGDIFSFKNTNSFSRDNLNYESGSVRNIHYGDIHTKFKTQFNLKNELVPFVNEEINIDKIPVDNYCKVGDLVIADASEDYADIGKAIEIVNINDEKVLAGLHTFLARPDLSKMALGFAGYLMKTEKVRLQIMTIAQGTKVLSISTGRLANITINYPLSTINSKKIANFLTAIDEKIQALKQKKTLLEQYKKGVMQQIFGRDVALQRLHGIRFKQDYGTDFPDWEEKNLGEIASKKSSNISANKIEDNFGNFIIYGAAGILKRVDFYEEENDYVSIVKDGAGAGRLLFCKGKSSVLGTMEIIKPKFGVNTYFLFYLLSTFDFTKYVTGSTIPHIYFKDYSLEICGLPTLPEQQKIANFLSAIDEKITNVELQIMNMQVWKKGLLQAMFC